jgi:hypothetical protein
MHILDYFHSCKMMADSSGMHRTGGFNTARAQPIWSVDRFEAATAGLYKISADS